MVSMVVQIGTRLKALGRLQCPMVSMVVTIGTRLKALGRYSVLWYQWLSRLVRD